MTSNSTHRWQLLSGCLAALLTTVLTASIRAENREVVVIIMQRIDEVVAKGPFAADWQSLKSYQVPEWFTDAKFGIYTHWGVYSVPAYHNEWYPRHMYAALADYHREHHGPQSEFGYKDFIPNFRAERWDPEQWAELYRQAGARFAGTVSQHHDGFAMWDSVVNRWNSGHMGPKRDITGQLAKSLRKRNMRVAVTFHHAWNVIGGYDATPWSLAVNAIYPRTRCRSRLFREDRIAVHGNRSSYFPLVVVKRRQCA